MYVVPGYFRIPGSCLLFTLKETINSNLTSVKTILLLRHAKSSYGGTADFERPLNEEGKKDAPLMGSFVSKSNSVPDQIISSTAKRARQTTELLNGILALNSKLISWNEDLYYGNASAYMKAVQHTGQNVDTVMLVGHNPSIEESISLLVADSSAYITSVPSAGLICIEHPAIKWEQIKPGTARLKWMMIPEMLKDNP